MLSAQIRTQVHCRAAQAHLEQFMSDWPDFLLCQGHSRLRAGTCDRHKIRPCRPQLYPATWNGKSLSPSSQSRSIGAETKVLRKHLSGSPICLLLGYPSPIHWGPQTRQQSFWTQQSSIRSFTYPVTHSRISLPNIYKCSLCGRHDAKC